MKIYYIANARMPSDKAYGIQLAKMCEAMVEAGIDLTLVLPWFGARCTHSIRKVYGLRVDIPIVSLPVVSVLRRTRIGFNAGAFSFALASFIFVLWRRLIDRGQALVYALDMDQFSFFLLPLAGLPVFLEAHGSKRRNILTRYFFNHLRGVVANSGGTKNALIQIFGIGEGQTLVAPNGIDLRHFESLPDQADARDRLELTRGTPIALYVGRFYDWKGLAIMVDAAKKAPEISWYLVGGDRVTFQEAAGVKDIPENILCVGGKSFVEIPLWLAAADVLLVLGTKKNEYSWKETSPMKLFEYMAAIRPIVTSATPANLEIVSDREAFLYEADNSDSLVEQVRYALNDTAVVASKVQRASNKVQQWTWAMRAERVSLFLRDQVSVK